MQTIALISDIHGNVVGLDAVLAELDRLRPDRVVCLGDVAATGPAPRECIARLRERGWPVVRGNTDDTLLRMAAGEEGASDDPHKAIDAWCAAQLEGDDLAFLRSLQPVIAFAVEGKAVCCAHGSPRSYDDGVLPETPEAEFAPWLERHPAFLYAGGHTHVAMLRRYREGFLVNPGSVGLPFTHLADGSATTPGWAEFGVVRVDGGSVAIELRRIPVDRGRALALARERNMPHLNWWSDGAE